MEYVGAALLGFAGGAVGGLLGVGGGILFVPALVIFLDEPQIRAEATSLLAIIPVAMVGAWRQHGYGNVRVRDGLVLAALSPLGVLIGVQLSNATPSGRWSLHSRPCSCSSPCSSCAERSGPKPALERALDRSVERVQPVERQGLGRGKAGAAATASGAGVGPVVGEHARQQREPALLRKRRGGRADELGADRQVSE